MNVVFEKSTITCLPPWPITSRSCCLNSGAVYRSTSPAREMTYASSEICSVLMSKFMCPPGARWRANCRVILLGGGLRGGRSRLRRERRDLLLHLGGERVVRRQLQELLVGGERRRAVAGGLCRLPELELRVRIRRRQLCDLDVRLLGVPLCALVVLVRRR